MEKRRCCNLGCGGDYRTSTGEEEWINVDKNDRLQADVYADLEDASLPIPGNSQDYVIAKHVIEHIHNIVPFMDEVWRILKPGGVFEIHAPYWTHKWAWGDPTHVRAFFEGSFIFWDKEEVAKQVANGQPVTQLDCKANFKTKEVKPLLDIGVKDSFKGKPDELRYALEHHTNIIAELQFVLEAVK